MKEKGKWFKAYVNCFAVLVYITSLLFMSGLIDKLNLPKGILSALVEYGYYLLHTVSFGALMFYGKEILK